MRIGVPKETLPGETRVALVPAAVAPLLKAGLEVAVEAVGRRRGRLSRRSLSRAGRVGRAARRSLPDRRRRSCRCARCRRTLRCGPVRPSSASPTRSASPQAVREAAATGVTMLSMELMPRITRAQSMDALSSMATIAGYKGVLLAANLLPRMFPMLMTAAGTVSPARVFIVGAGVAGLQAIASARRLGARIEALRRATSREGAGPEPRGAGSSSCRSNRRTPRTRAATPRRRTNRSTGGSAR